MPRNLRNMFMQLAMLSGWCAATVAFGQLPSPYFFDDFEDGNVIDGNPVSWNADGEFTSGDLVAAFQDGGYEKGPRTAAAAVPEPSMLVLGACGLLMSTMQRRCR